jgi:hypothetical protein
MKQGLFAKQTRMKTYFKISGVLLAVTMSLILFPKTVAAQQDDVSLQVFYDELSPYGQWVDYPEYGYVWIPDAGAAFVPYSTRGQWIYSDYGWIWASDYVWGWAPFHYGRWDYDFYYGWFWIPDYDWGPSWVIWRKADGYYGWQPMRPGINIITSFGNDYYNSDNDYWMFVRDRDFQKSNVSRYFLDKTNRDRIIRNSTVINNTYVDHRRNTTYVSGPGREEVQRLTGKNIHPVIIKETTRPGQTLGNGQLHIYRPLVSSTKDQGRKPVPIKITNIGEVKRPFGSNATNQRSTDVNPSNDSKLKILPNTAKQQNSRKTEQPVRQQMNENSSDKKHEQQQNQAVPQNREDNKAKQNVVPSESKGKEQQQNIVTPQDNKMKVQPSRSTIKQPDAGRQELKQKTVTPQNTNRNNRQTRTAKEKADQKQNN